jgi:hypothetical protein
MSDPERNGQRYNAEEIAAIEMERLLSLRDRRAEINLGWPRYVDRHIRDEWQNEGYGKPLTFVDADGNPIVIARFEDEELYDDKGLVRQDRDVSYRVYLPNETREVTVPYQLTPGIGQDMDSDDYVFYDLSSEMAAFELSLLDDVAQENMHWLHKNLGSVLVARKAGMVSPRLVADGRVKGIRLDAFSVFTESDF